MFVQSSKEPEEKCNLRMSGRCAERTHGRLQKRDEPKLASGVVAAGMIRAVVAIGEPTATNEPTDLPKNATNEPTDDRKNATNEPTVAWAGKM
jgi:hypothetical protein